MVMKMTGFAEIKRVTKETDIQISLTLDGKGKSDINTGIGFLTICWPDLPNTACLI